MNAADDPARSFPDGGGVTSQPTVILAMLCFGALAALGGAITFQLPRPPR